MSEPRVNGLRGVELAVYDLNSSVDFYLKNWGLSEVSRSGGRAYLRATGDEHHIVTLHERPKAGLVAVNMAAADRAAVDALHAKAKGMGVEIVGAPEALSAEGGGGYGFDMRTPEGHTIRISSDVARHADTIADPTRPVRANHVVFNSPDIDNQMQFFLDTLGFKFSDFSGHMHFIRCSRNHHAVAIAKASGAGLNHIAFEMKDYDGLMRGVGRMRMADEEIGWGVGRHAGPGRNVFSYFVDPNGYAIEYTTDVDQAGDDYVSRREDYWANLPLRPCAWAGAKMVPTARMRDAMAGKLIEERNQTCDDVISQKMAG